MAGITYEQAQALKTPVTYEEATALSPPPPLTAASPPAPAWPPRHDFAGGWEAIRDAIPNFVRGAYQNALDEAKDPRGHQLRLANEAGQSVMGRASMGMVDVPAGLAQLFANATGRGAEQNQFQADREAAYEAGKAEVGATGTDVARFAGNIASPATVATGAVMGLPRSFAQAIGMGALAGGGGGLATPTPVGETDNYWKSKAEQIGIGAAFGGVIAPAAYGIGKGIAYAAPRVGAFFGKGASAAREKVRTQAAAYADQLAQKADEGVAGVTNLSADAAARQAATQTDLTNKIADILEQRTSAQAAAKEGVAGARADVDALTRQLEGFQNTLRAIENRAVPTETMGLPGTRTQTGEAAISAVTAQRDALVAARRQLDDGIRPVVDDIVALAERSDKAVADLPSAQALLQEARAYLSPPAAGAGRVAERAATPLTGIYKKIVDAIETQSMELTADEAAIARAAGQVVRAEPAGPPTYTVTVPSRRGASAQEIPAASAEEAEALARQTGGKVNEGPPAGETYYLDFENTFNALNNLARHLGDSFQTDMQGFGGVPIKLMRNKAAQLQEILTEFVDTLPGGKVPDPLGGPNPVSLRQMLQDNWAERTKVIETYETGLAAALTKPDANVATAIDTIQQYGAAGLRSFLESTKNPDAAYAAAEEIIKRALYSADKPMDLGRAQTATGAGTLTDDLIQALPSILGERGVELQNRVKDHLARLADVQRYEDALPGAKAAVTESEKGLTTATKLADELEQGGVKADEASVKAEGKARAAVSTANDAYLTEQAELAKKMDAATKAKRGIERLQADLKADLTSPSEILKMAKDTVEEMHLRGLIEIDEYNKVKNSISETGGLQANKARVAKYLVAAAAAAAGAGGVLTFRQPATEATRWVIGP